MDFEAVVWLYEGRDPWHFITVPMELSENARDFAAGSPRGFGSIRVVATIGITTWKTSLFPDKELNSLVLPIKASVRSSEKLAAGDVVTVHLEIVG